MEYKEYHRHEVKYIGSLEVICTNPDKERKCKLGSIYCLPCDHYYHTTLEDRIKALKEHFEANREQVKELYDYQKKSEGNNE